MQESLNKPETYGNLLEATKSYWHKLAPKLPPFDPSKVDDDSSSDFSADSDVKGDKEEQVREKSMLDSQVHYFLCGSFSYWWPVRMVNDAELEMRVMSSNEGCSPPPTGAVSPLGGRSQLTILKDEIQA